MDGYIELTPEKLKTDEGVGELNRMLQKIFQVIAGDGQNARVYHGFGSPLNVVTANIGSIYMRKDGAANTSIYVKEANNNSAAGWVAK